jgi:hypothetical protein
MNSSVITPEYHSPRRYESIHDLPTSESLDYLGNSMVQDNYHSCSQINFLQKVLYKQF